MVQIAHGWELSVERGPDWLFVKPLGAPDEAGDEAGLARTVWAMLERNFSNRLVLELDHITYLNSHLVGQLVWLHKRIHSHGGLMRISGLSELNQDILSQCRLAGRFPHFATREEAVMSARTTHPR